VTNPNSIVAGDNDPLVATLSDIRGPVNLQGATVEFELNQATPGVGHAPFTGTCDVLQGVDGGGNITSKGVVSYSWAAGQTDLAGVYRLRWRVTWSSGKTRTFPNSGPGVTWEIES
jgi:hypothetical protein